jgi:predicted anti-sigma-YlaC factor YlaD
MSSMNCDTWEMAISARADGEDPGVDERLISAHLAGCASCRMFATAVDGSRRAMRLPDEQEMPDVSRRVSTLTAMADRASRWGLVRALLVVVAVEVIALSAPSLFDNQNHDARHLGAFSIAYGVSLIVVAVRPARARTVLPVATVLAGALLITTVVDLGRGVVPLTEEATHLPEVVSVLLVWLLTVPRPRPRRRRGIDAAPASVAGAPPSLTVVRSSEPTTEGPGQGSSGSRQVGSSGPRITGITGITGTGITGTGITGTGERTAG